MIQMLAHTPYIRELSPQLDTKGFFSLFIRQNKKEFGFLTKKLKLSIHACSAKAPNTFPLAAFITVSVFSGSTLLQLECKSSPLNPSLLPLYFNSHFDCLRNSHRLTNRFCKFASNKVEPNFILRMNKIK